MYHYYILNICEIKIYNKYNQEKKHCFYNEIRF